MVEFRVLYPSINKKAPIPATSRGSFVGDRPNSSRYRPNLLVACSCSSLQLQYAIYLPGFQVPPKKCCFNPTLGIV